ncbi:hypothetical protein ACFFRR_000281 [Megaselia abdita]
MSFSFGNTSGFGTPAAKPAFGGNATSSFNFGTPAASATQPSGFGNTTAFGTPVASVAPTFGAAAAAPAFGATPAPAFGATAATASAFGTPAVAAPAFGTAATPAFGTPASAAPAFGAPAVAAPAPAFGAPTLGSAAASSFGGFGAAATPAASVAPSFGGFGATARLGAPPGVSSAAPSFSGFGAAATAPAASSGFSFGATASTAAAAPASNFSFNTGAAGGAFGKPAASVASLSFGTTTTSAGTLGLFGKPTTAVGLTTTTVAAPPAFMGLGGVDINTLSQPKPGDQAQNNVKVKETLVPDEIAKTVEDLKAYIKLQKTLSSDIGRASLSKLYSVTNEIQTLKFSLQEVTNSVEQTYNQSKSLRKETSKAIQSAEIAQRTNDTPAGLQFENTAPFMYFVSLVEKYEQDLITYRNQITAIENHMKSIMNPQGINPTELKNGLQHINECFISLAGRLHEIHQKVEAQKEQFLNLRKYRLRDTENVFACLEQDESKKNSVKITSGPTPFSNVSGMSNFGMSFGRTGSTTNP